ncbi:MAG: glycosyltransferase family 4 protein [bacterium]
MKKKKVLLYSRLAFYPMHWEAFKLICKEHDVEPSVITIGHSDLPDGHRMLGTVDIEHEKKAGFSPTIYYLPYKHTFRKIILIFKYLRKIKPDVVWAQEEPIATYIIPLLIFYFFKKRPRIIIAVVENIFPLHGIKKLFYNTLWKRVNGILSIAPGSTEAIRAVGMPTSIPVYDFVAGCLSPGVGTTAAIIPIRKNPQDFIVGYVGRLIEEKGWKVVLRAIQDAPPHFKFAVAGNGNQLDELKAAIEDPKLAGRIYYAGLLQKKDLWKFYMALDCLTVPSLTTKTWKEQFGGVLADAMAVGIPIVGSDSGSVPSVTGPAGLIVPENNPAALLEALKKLEKDVILRKTLGENGKKRFEKEFSIPAYARKIAHGLDLN